MILDSKIRQQRDNITYEDINI